MESLLVFKNSLFLLVIILNVAHLISGEKQCTHDHKREKYDFIVVGGGQAGCVVAARLSEYPEFKVLLLEAGGKPPALSQAPLLAFLMSNTKDDWNFTSVPQKYANDRIFALVRGKMLGGSGSLNRAIWYRGNKRDYDLWRDLGVDGWQWENILEYFKKSEQDFSTDANDFNSGFSGPVKLQNEWKGVTLFSALIDYFKKLGYNYKDPHDGEQVGYSISRTNTYLSRRQSSYTNYLLPVLKRKNLKVIKFATVEKVLFNDRNEAIGVLYSKCGKKFEVKAKREVILSAGAINTPQILMLSGIGHREHLESFNIKVMQELPVGDNFHDHIVLRANFTKPANGIFNRKNFNQFFRNRGPLTNFSSVNAFINTDLSSDSNFPDVQCLAAGQFLDKAEQLVYALWWYNLRPKGRGTIRLQSNDPFDHPLIDPNYLSETHDMQVLLRMAQSIFKTGNAIEKLQNEFTFHPFVISNCKHLNNNTDEYWRCIVKNNMQMSCHFCCSARMGSPNSSSAVVDSSLRIIGVNKLRVIDASVMPTVPSANIQAVVTMIAEKGSDLLKQAHVKSLYHVRHL